MSSIELSAIRRRDRAKDEVWIQEFLTRAPYGFLATVRNGRPLLNSNLFVYDRDSRWIYLHTARVGQTANTAAAASAATFSAAVMGRLLPAPEALEFSVEYSAVVAEGHIESVTASLEKGRALEMLMSKYTPHLSAGRDYRPITSSELERTGVHRFVITSWSGKEKVGAPDHAGAFEFPNPAPPFLGGAA